MVGWRGGMEARVQEAETERDALRAENQNLRNIQSNGHN
jgi:FtsZ-binding cell division protein ZapB